MQKDLGFSLLLAYYGKLLPEKQAEMISEYYDLDLSLSEIAENQGMTRQGVRDAIKRAEQCLSEYEEKLGMIDKAAKLRSLYSDALSSGDCTALGAYIDELCHERRCAPWHLKVFRISFHRYLKNFVPKVK